MCESKELIVGFVYDELTPEERRALQAHLAECGECRSELEELRATRAYLASWSPPEPDLGFRMISGGAVPAPALPRRMRLAPAFAFAAAAVIVLAVAAAIANIEVRYGCEGLLVRTGWAPQGQRAPLQAQADTPANPQPQPVSAFADAGDFAELDRRLRQIESAMTRQPSGVQLASTDSGMSDAELMRRVREIVTEAQSRQNTVVTTKLLQIVRDFEVQRQSDIAYIQQGFDQYQGMTNAEIAQSRDMFNQWIRTAAARQEK